MAPHGEAFGQPRWFPTNKGEVLAESVTNGSLQAVETLKTVGVAAVKLLAMSLLKQVSVSLLRLFSSSTLDTRTRQASPEIEEAIVKARLRATYELTPAAMIGQLILAQAVYWVLSPRLPGPELLWWLVARQLISVMRLAHASLCLTGHIQPSSRDLPSFYFQALLDGFTWGMLGWWFTPLFQLEVAVVTISTLIGVAAMAALMLHVNVPMAFMFIVPTTVPCALYAAGRGDDLGYYACGAVLGLAFMLLTEASRSSRRIVEMLRLRFESEQANEAKTEALRQARLLAETKSRFVATMSHEMRTPLHGILGLVRLVKQDVQGLGNPKVMRNLALIEGSGGHLVNVINDVLDFSKSEAGGLSVHEQAFCLHDMLNELAETCQVHCHEKGLTLELSFKMSADDQVQGDPVRLRQVLHNLIGNAIKFTPRGKVSLHVWRDATTQAVVFEVRDTGIGIAPHEVSRVFDAFHQAEGTYERRFGGTGLGLTISRDLCRAMGGELRCESELGKGSVFVCELPLSVVAALPDMKADRDEARGALALMAEAGRVWDSGATAWPSVDIPLGDEQHILLVEDNPVNAMVAQAELERLGLRVTVVDNGFDAIEWLEHEQVDLVLMDCEMPVMDGIETTRRIRERERQRGKEQVGVIALTANGPDVFAERCLPAGMNDHLLKPFKPEELAEVLRRHLYPDGARGSTWAMADAAAMHPA